MPIKVLLTLVDTCGRVLHVHEQRLRPGLHVPQGLDLAWLPRGRRPRAGRCARVARGLNLKLNLANKNKNA